MKSKRVYYLENKDRILAQQKEYRERNREKIADKNYSTLCSDCGVIIRKNGLSRHLQTQRHKDSIKEEPVKCPVYKGDFKLSL